jgi:hypothetical protein
VKSGFISKITANGGSKWLSNLPVSLEVSFANNGTVLLIPSGYIEVRDVLGRLIERLDLNEGRKIALPGTNRVYQTSWGISSEEYARAITREIVKPLVGPFTITAAMNYDEKSTDTAQIMVWFFPWRLALLVGIAIAGVVVARRRLKKV